MHDIQANEKGYIFIYYGKTNCVTSSEKKIAKWINLQSCWGVYILHNNNPTFPGFHKTSWDCAILYICITRTVCKYIIF